MRYIDCPEPGAAENMQVAEGRKPEAGRGEVLIRVAAAGVNRPDIVQRQGFYPPPPGASRIMGLEVAGKIEALGEGVTGWQVGDQVCALTNGGGYAEYAAAPAAQCLPVPAGLGLVEAAALPETLFTVWSNVFDRAGLLSGETLLVHGGSSGIGTAAIQLASAMGARVYATAGSAEKCAACESLGASRAINYREEDFVEVILEETGLAGVDVILDMVGGDYVERSINVAAQDGRIVNIAFLQGAKVELNLMPLMLKRLTLTGSTLRARSPEVKAEIARALRTNVWPLIEAGQLRPQVYCSFPLEEVAEAHRLMETSQHIGKIVLTL
ncbi:NAD(P)H-quinone oxidoreductase [Biformimicrobium ophioploci]|uniref:NAD(P)H-quinone oxidoreductase n=1 Tax=Biformimicrobium ophioploci TaxID=3036711 RepID=A0ABQ6M2D3_9GAMM|nr:NAD(P)H-quinone oxidoreductase [Microbulbifer sp. NKW57]GMG88521.1 NAD(P)H-quinone oxidoreductase [Microbulbifer sp. NKW57]